MAGGCASCVQLQHLGPRVEVVEVFKVMLDEPCDLNRACVIFGVAWPFLSPRWTCSLWGLKVPWVWRDGMPRKVFRYLVNILRLLLFAVPPGENHLIRPSFALPSFVSYVRTPSLPFDRCRTERPAWRSLLPRHGGQKLREGLGP